MSEVTLQAFRQAVSAAIHPFQLLCEERDYGAQIRFRVQTADGRAVTPNILVRQSAVRNDLDMVVAAVRSKLRSVGHAA
jgi:hypothetical protein